MQAVLKSKIPDPPLLVPTVSHRPSAPFPLVKTKETSPSCVRGKRVWVDDVRQRYYRRGRASLWCRLRRLNFLLFFVGLEMYRCRGTVSFNLSEVVLLPIYKYDESRSLKKRTKRRALTENRIKCRESIQRRLLCS